MSAVGNYVAKYCLKVPALSTPTELRINELISTGSIPGTFFLMSKGIGQGYVNRMLRFHVPPRLKGKEKIEVVCDRASYHDGKFKYKLPRFYRDRLFRKKFPCDARVWNPKRKCYEDKIVYRYQSKNPLAIAMQNEIRSRILAEYDRRVSEYRFTHPNLSDTEIHIALARLEKGSALDRQKDLYSKMSRFYNSQRFMNRDF